MLDDGFYVTMRIVCHCVFNWRLKHKPTCLHRLLPLDKHSRPTSFCDLMHILGVLLCVTFTVIAEKRRGIPEKKISECLLTCRKSKFGCLDQTGWAENLKLIKKLLWCKIRYLNQKRHLIFFIKLQ